MNLYNREKLVKVTVNKACPARWYELRKERKILGFTVQKAGIYRVIFENYLGSDVPEYHFIKDGDLYENPEVILHYQADHGKTYYFDTYEQAQKFAEEIVSLGTFIE